MRLLSGWHEYIIPLLFAASHNPDEVFEYLPVAILANNVLLLHHDGQNVEQHVDYNRLSTFKQNCSQHCHVRCDGRMTPKTLTTLKRFPMTIYKVVLCFTVPRYVMSQGMTCRMVCHVARDDMTPIEHCPYLSNATPLKLQFSMTIA